jgi:hypothetical protein
MLGSLGTTRYPARDRVMFLLSLKAGCHLQKSCSTTSEILCTHVQKWVVYLSPADNSAGPAWNCPRDVNQTVMTSHIGFPRPRAGCWPST